MLTKIFVFFLTPIELTQTTIAVKDWIYLSVPNHAQFEKDPRSEGNVAQGAALPSDKFVYNPHEL